MQMIGALGQHRPLLLQAGVEERLPLPGVVILGGAHGALAVGRCFGRQNIPVVLVTDDHPLPKFSRYVRHSYCWPSAEASDRCDWLAELARLHGLHGWLLVPCGDREVALVTANIEFLRADYQIISSAWPSLPRLCDKQLLAEAAAEAGVDCPANYS